jgi:hypothetical protein
MNLPMHWKEKYKQLKSYKMKNGLTWTAPFRYHILMAGLLLLLVVPFNLFAQKDSIQKEAPVVEVESSLISPSIEFKSIQKGDSSIDLKAALKARIKGTFYKLPLLKITFVLVTDTAEKVLGFVITDQQGKAAFNVKAGSLKTDATGKLHFKAQFAGNKQMDAAAEEVTIKRALLVITPVKEDSLLTVKVKLIDMGAGTETPVPKTVLGIYVNRLFNPLKIGEGTTDENGEATVEVPNNLPGDTKGNITLLAKLDESEVYGNLEAAAIEKWGIPVSDKIEIQQRSLFSSNPPVWMLVTFIILMVVVWGHYLFIVYELFRLRKEGLHKIIA